MNELPQIEKETETYLWISGLITVMVSVSFAAFTYYQIYTFAVLSYHSYFHTVDDQSKFPVLIPVCDRSNFFEDVIVAICNAKRIKETTLVISQDCGRRKDTTKIIDDKTCARHVIHLHHIPPFFSIPSVVTILWPRM